MGKPAFFAYAKTKAQISCAVLCGNYRTEYLPQKDGTIPPLLPKSDNVKPLAILCGCTVLFVSDRVGNLEDRFSSDTANMKVVSELQKLDFMRAKVKSNSPNFFLQNL